MLFRSDDLVVKLWGRERQGGPETLGEDGEATREEGGRMGPWSKGGVRIGEKEKWKWLLKGEIKEAHSRTIYSVDWATGGLDKKEGGLGRLLTCGGDGVINVFQMVRSRSWALPNLPQLTSLLPQTQPAPKSSPLGAPGHQLVASIDSAHGVSDVNDVSWCRLSPAKAAETLRRLEGGEGEEDAEMADESREPEEDVRWAGCENMFASAGDDGVVRVWRVDGGEAL